MEAEYDRARQSISSNRSRSNSSERAVDKEKEEEAVAAAEEPILPFSAMDASYVDRLLTDMTSKTSAPTEKLWADLQRYVTTWNGFLFRAFLAPTYEQFCETLDPDMEKRFEALQDEIAQKVAAPYVNDGSVSPEQSATLVAQVISQVETQCIGVLATYHRQRHVEQQIRLFPPRPDEVEQEQEKRRCSASPRHHRQGTRPAAASRIRVTVSNQSREERLRRPNQRHDQPTFKRRRLPARRSREKPPGTGSKRTYKRRLERKRQRERQLLRRQRQTQKTPATRHHH